MDNAGDPRESEETDKMAKANKKHKDSTFSLYFSDKERLIEIVNAIYGTNYPKDTEVEINTLEDALYKDRKNDISFILDGKWIVLIEHQSTLNENMPVRILVYIGQLYEKVIQLQKIYGSTLVKIPAPRFVVLYNGEDDCPDHRVMKLSDAFITKNKDPALELKVDLYNINYGKSDILQKSPSLNEYSTFIHYIRQEQKEHKKPLNEAISAAVNRAVQEGIMKEFLLEHGSEVRNMLFEEWDWEQYVAVQREEGRAKGREEGRKAGREEGREEGRIEGENRILRQAVATMMSSMSPEKIADALCVSLSRVQAILQQIPDR